MILFFAVLGLIAALLLGIWLGLGRFSQSSREIERALDERGRRKRVHRHFTPIDLLKPRKHSSRERERPRFRTAAPKRVEEGVEEDATTEENDDPTTGGAEEHDSEDRR